MSKQTKGSGILTYTEGVTTTNIIVKHITKIKFETVLNTTTAYIYTLETKHPSNFKIAKSDEQALIDFIRSEQNLVKPKSVTGSILAAACLI